MLQGSSSTATRRSSRHRPQGTRGAPGQIADNAGAPGEVVVEKVKGLDKGHGYDALVGEYGDLFEKGIVDAAKVTRSALQNAASIAAMVLTTETVVTDIPEKEKAVAGGSHDHGGGTDF